MKTLGRNADNDLYLEAGGLAILHDAEAQCAIIESVLMTQQGELQFDDEAGIDYFGTVFQNPNNIRFWAAQVTSKIEALDFVSAVEDFEYRFDNKTGTLYWSMTVINTDNDRLDLLNKKTVLDGSPGVDVSWNDIYDKPDKVDETLDMVEAMRDEAQEVSPFTNSTRLERVKEVINRVVYDPSNPTYAETRKITFKFVGVPLGTVIDFSNLKLGIENTGTTAVPKYATFGVSISDGTNVRIQPSSDGVGLIRFGSGELKTAQHTITSSGIVTVAIQGNIESIWSEESSRPILLRKDGSAFPYLSAMQIGERVPLKEVGDGVFRNFSNLQNIQWEVPADSSRKITFGNYAFANCRSLLDLTWIPKPLESVGKGCFSGCTSLTSLKGLALVSSITQLPDESFAKCTSLTSIEGIPQSITSLGDKSFLGCSALPSLDSLPDGIVAFGNNCFSGCLGIETLLYLPSGLHTIGEGCFGAYDDAGETFPACTALRSLFLPKSLTSIKDDAFAGCSALSQIMCEGNTPPTITATTFNQDVDAITIYVPMGAGATYKDASGWEVYADSIKEYGTASITLSNVVNGTTLLGSTSLIESESIWQVEYEGDTTKPYRYESSATSLPTYTYNSTPVDEVSNIVIKGFIKTISAASSSAFPFIATVEGGENSLVTEAKLNLPTSLETIGDYAFALCPNLKTFDIGEEEEGEEQQQSDVPLRLGAYAFYGCTNLEGMGWLERRPNFGLVIESEEGESKTYYPAFGEGCFYKSGITTIGYPSTYVQSLPAYCFAYTDIVELTGVGFSEGITPTIGDHCFAGCSKLTSIAGLPAEIFVLPDYCFEECTSLATLSGISNINYLGEGCFKGSGLTSIEALANASNLVSLPSSCFENCGSLTSLDGINNITTIGKRCFAGCTSLTDIKALRKITAIPDYCFSGCTQLKSLIGCRKVKSIGEGAFQNCTGLLAPSGLGADITTIGANAFSNCTGLLYFSCIATTPPSMGSSAFSGVQVSALTLYVREGFESTYSANLMWATFGTITSRTIKIRYEGIDTIAFGGYVEALIDNANVGVWYADWGDGTTYSSDDTTTTTKEYEVLKDYTVSLFGDVSEIKGKGQIDPFFGIDSAAKATAITIASPFLKKIGDYCFYDYGIGDRNLDVSIQMAENGTIGNYAFSKTNETKTNGVINTIPVCNAVSVGNHAFEYCGLTSSAAFVDLISAGEYAFANNENLADLTGFGSLADVPTGMFSGCVALTSTSGLANAKTIGENAFSGCTGLTTVRDFGPELNEIKADAFAGCDNIQTVFMAIDNPPELAETGFSADAYQNAMLYVPAGSVQDYSTKDYWTSFEKGVHTRSITFNFSNLPPNASIPGGMALVTSSGNWAITYSYLKAGEQKETTLSYSAGTNVPVDSFIFADGGIASISISGPITAIKSSSSFSMFGPNVRGSLNGITISSAMDITTIGDYCFANCTQLESIIGVETITSIGIGAFSGCVLLESLSGFHSVSTIGASAFSGCTGLKRIDGLGENITSIGANAFANCTGLTEVQMFAPNPPSLGLSAFDGIDLTTIPLYVRSKSVPSYTASSDWNTFTFIRSRYIEFSLSNCPEDTDVELDLKGIKAHTYTVVEWDDASSDGFDCTGEKLSADTAEHTYALIGDHTFRIEGDISTIASSIIPEVTESEGTITISGDSFVTTPQGNYLTSVSKNEYATLLEVGQGAFLNNPNLTAVDLAGITSVGFAAFAFTGLTSLGFVESVGTFGAYSFYGCHGIPAVTNLGGNGQDINIGYYAFADINDGNPPEYIQVGVQNPSNITLDTEEKPFGNLDDAQKGNIYVYVPLSSVGLYQLDEFWKKFKIASQVIEFVLTNVPSGTTILGKSFSDSVGTSYIRSASPWVVDWGDDTADHMSSSETTFPAHTYAYSDDLPESQKNLWVNRTVNGETIWYRSSIHIAISGTLESIGCQSMADSPFLAIERGRGNPYLTSISASDSLIQLETIGDYTFRGCSALTDVNGFTNVKSIGDYAFQGCTNLLDLGSVIAGNPITGSGFLGVTSIGNNAFADCTSLNSIAAFPSVLTIGVRAFANDIGLASTTGLGLAYRDMDSEEWSEAGLSAAFGAQAFEGCSFGYIDIENYQVPPAIQTSTFPGDPANVMVFTSPEGGETVRNAYRTAPVWQLYFANIISSASVAFTFGAGVITGGVTISGANCGIDFFGTYVAIDWGDGSIDSATITDSLMTGWTLPDHTYPADFQTTGAVTVRLRGDIKAIYSKNTTDPIIALYGSTLTTKEVVGSEVDANDRIIFTIQSTEVSVEYENGRFVRKEKSPTTSTSFSNDTTPTIIVDRTTPVTTERIEKFVVGAGARVESVGQGCFRGCNVVNVEIGKPSQDNLPDGQATRMVSIGDFAFYQNTILMGVCITDNAENVIASIGDSAFEGCYSLDSIAFISGCHTLGPRAFYGCSGISSIAIPASMTSIGTSCFEGCSGIGKDGIVWASPEDSSTLSAVIGEKAFFGCSGVNNEAWRIYIPSSVHTIGSEAFAGCGMSSFEWDSSNQVGNYDFAAGAVSVFENCAKLNRIEGVFPSVSFIPERAFFGCSNLGDTKFIPSSVTTIGSKAFSGCPLSRGIFLNQVTSLTSIASDSFEGCRESLLKLPASQNVFSISEYAFAYHTNLVDIYWDKDDNLPTPSVGAHCFEGCSSLFKIHSFGGVSSIPAHCFFLCSSLEDVNTILSDAEGKIGDYCFAGCIRLGGVTIPETVTSLGEGCFNCSSERFLRGFYDDVALPEETQRNYGTIASFERWMYQGYKDKRVDVWAEYEKKCYLAGENIGPSSLYWKGADSVEITNVEDALTAMQQAGIDISGITDFGGIIEALGLSDDATPDSIAQAISPEVGNNYSIGPGCFMNCSSMVVEKLPNLIDLPTFAFYNCRSLFMRIGFRGLVNTNTQGIGKFSLAHTNLSNLGVWGQSEQLYLSLSPAVFLGCQSLFNISALSKVFGSVPSALPDACFYGCSSLSDISVLGQYGAPVRSLGNYCFAGCNSLDFSQEGQHSVYNVLTSVSKIGDGCFKGCATQGNSTMYIPRLLGYLPYMSFSNNFAVTEIVFTYTQEEGEPPTAKSVTLEGDSFAGCERITKVTLPYPSVASIVTASGKDDTGTTFSSSDPFSAIETKSGVTVEVPDNFVDAYKENTYWTDFNITKGGGVIPVVDDAIVQMHLNVPSEGATLTLTGKILVPGGGQALITWGDGGETQIKPETVNVSHTYSAGNYELYISGAVSSLSGIVAEAITGPYYKPLFSSSIDTATNTYSNNVVTVVSILDAAYGPTGYKTGGNPMGPYCFYNHTSLNIVDIRVEVAPKIAKIQPYTFYGCRELMQVNVGGSLSALTEIGDYAFRYTEKLPTLAFLRTAANLTTIGTGGFYGIGLQNLNTLPVTITSLGANAFAWCNSLETLAGIENLTRLTSLPARCFRGCRNLSDISAIEGKFTQIPTGCFSECTNLDSGSMSTLALTQIGVEAFANSGMSNFNGVASADTIGARAFSGTNIMSLSGMPANALTAEGCFAGCQSLTEIVLSSNKDILISNGCFDGCTNIESIELSANITSIGLRAFRGCPGITRIVLLRYSSGAITQIVAGGEEYRETEPGYENRAFDYDTIAGNEGFSISVPSAAVTTYRNANGWSNFGEKIG